MIKKIDAVKAHIKISDMGGVVRIPLEQCRQLGWEDNTRLEVGVESRLGVPVLVLQSTVRRCSVCGQTGLELTEAYDRLFCHACAARAVPLK